MSLAKLENAPPCRAAAWPTYKCYENETYAGKVAL